MRRSVSSLRSKLERECTSLGAVVFGVASAKDVDALEKIRIVEFELSYWSSKVAEIMDDARSVVVFGIGTKDDADDMAVRRKEREWSYPGYLPLRRIADRTVSVLREEGFKAEIPPEPVARKRIAVLAGIGGYGKNSMILNKDHGLSLRFEIVVTDADIPRDRPFKKDLCGECDRCVRSCPTKAIKPYVLDPHKCLVHIAELGSSEEGLQTHTSDRILWLTPSTHLMCTICQLACPYTSAERRRNVIRRGNLPT